MRMLVRLLSVTVVLLGAAIPQIIHGQTPLPNVRPKLTIRWLNTLSVDPTPISRDSQKIYLATVRLLRPTGSRLKVDLELVGGHPIPRIPDSLHVECVWIHRSTYVQPGEDHVSFDIHGESLIPRVGSQTMVPKAITIAALYGSERMSTTFTVNCSQ